MVGDGIEDEEDSLRSKRGSEGAGIGKNGFVGFKYIYRREAIADLSYEKRLVPRCCLRQIRS